MHCLLSNGANGGVLNKVCSSVAVAALFIVFIVKQLLSEREESQ